MNYKDKDRRIVAWLSIIYILTSPIQVKAGLDIEAIKFSVMSLMGLGIANYFSKPSKEL